MRWRKMRQVCTIDSAPFQARRALHCHFLLPLCAPQIIFNCDSVTSVNSIRSACLFGRNMFFFEQKLFFFLSYFRASKSFLICWPQNKPLSGSRANILSFFCFSAAIFDWQKISSYCCYANISHFRINKYGKCPSLSWLTRNDRSKCFPFDHLTKSCHPWESKFGHQICLIERIVAHITTATNYFYHFESATIWCSSKKEKPPREKNPF